MSTSITERPYKHSFSENEIRYAFAVTDPTTAGCAVEVAIYTLGIAASGAGTLLTSFELTPNPDGTVYCHINSYLKSLLKPQLFDITGQIAQPVTTQCLQYYIQYRQITTADANPSWTDDVANTKIIVQGGVEKMKFKRNNFFVTYQNAAQKFLTWQPSGRFVFQNQKHFLTYLHTSETATDAYIDITTAFSTGELNNQQIAFTNVTDSKLYHIAAGVEQLGLETIDPTKQIHYYDIRIIDQDDNVLAATHRFYVDYRNFYNSHDFIFFNSLGGWDCLRATGDFKWEIDKELEDASAIIYNDAYNTVEPTSQFFQTNILKKDMYKGDIGFFRTKDQHEAAIELFISKYIFEIIDSRWIRLLNLKKAQDVRNNKSKKWNHAIDWQYAYNDAVFTPKNIMLGAGTNA